ncbi:hypothetical protein Tco_0503542, partial [Tanacetum coccineum]
MSGSEPGEMALKSSQTVVLPKFDMHIYTSEVTSKELTETVTEYCIPADLHPRLSPPDLPIDKLPSRYIEIYMEQHEQGGLRIPFSAFFLTVIKHFGVHVSQLVPMGVNRIEGQVSDTMPWRRIDTDVQDNFLNHNNEGDAERLTKFPVPFRPPPRHLLYVYGLTTACRHPELSYIIKDPEGKALSMDDFLKLPVWNGNVVSKRDPIPNDQSPRPHVTLPLAVGEPIPDKSPFQMAIKKPDSKIVAAREKKEKQNLAKTQAKHVGEGAPSSPRKKRNTAGGTAVGTSSENIEKEVVDLSKNTHVPTPPITIVQLSPDVGHGDTQNHAVFSD